ncbi:hypothetical protein GCM10023185_41930 [Hymenobacter saemangeumensis]|uniref:Uncharacterized protein n=1 Tax=Hymenobacter saemangeumensis TaxID=1084522 RepID=A0ABP8IRI0_9BACT
MIGNDTRSKHMALTLNDEFGQRNTFPAARVLPNEVRHVVSGSGGDIASQRQSRDKGAALNGFAWHNVRNVPDEQETIYYFEMVAFISQALEVGAMIYQLLLH